MLVVEVLAGLLLVLAVALAGVAVRRRLLERGGGTIELSLRLRDLPYGRGWSLGLGRFEGDELRWYRVFSLAPRWRRTLSRTHLEVLERRDPVGGEALALLSGAVVLRCAAPGGVVELALDAEAVTGFLAWLEARPPGATLPA